VNYARVLYERFKHLIHELAKFGVVGGFGFIVTEAGTNLLHFQAGMGPLTSNVVATIVAACITFAGNRYWTFRHRDRTGLAREYLTFFVLNGIGLLIQLGCLGFAYYVLGMTDKLSYNVALLIGIAFGTLFRFWAYRTWVWRAGGPEVPTETLPPATAGAPAAAGPAGQAIPQANGHLVGGTGTTLPPVPGGTGGTGHDTPL
jgi:putative flippase GtrA